MLRVAACSYEGSLFGWDLLPSDGGEAQPPYSAHLHFGFNVTVNSSLRSIAVSKSGRYLAAGGMNERINLFNVAENKGIGEISGHTGAVTALEFFEDSMLLSASEDGTLYIWRVHDWEHLHILGGHKATVLDFAIHPTGKLALSVSKDRTLKLWNLIQGKCAFTRSLRIAADFVAWHPAGTHYLLCAAKEVQVFQAADNSIACAYKSAARLNHAQFVCLDRAAQEFGFACVDDAHCLVLVDMKGVVRCTVDLSSLSLGRPRALSVTAAVLPSASAPVDVVTIVTSTGCMISLDVTRLESVSAPAPVDGDSSTGSRQAKAVALLGAAVLCVHEIGAEPRMTAVTSWVNFSGKAAEKAQAPVAVESQPDTESGAADEEEHVQGKKKRKRVSFPDAEAPAPALVKSKGSGKRKGKR